MDETKPRGGPDRGQGRKPLDEKSSTVVMPVRMTEEQRSKVVRLGGAKWIRSRIDKARMPKENDDGK